MRLLGDHGTLTPAEVMAPAIAYARDGHPVLARVSATIAGLRDFFEREWPTSAATWLPGETVPAAGALFRNPDLAVTYQRLADEASAAGPDRRAQVEAARTAWSDGFVARTITDYLACAEVADAEGQRARALLSGDDLHAWRARIEAPVSLDYHGWTVFKTGPWGQGPVLLQTLAILRGMDLGAMDPLGAEFVHTVIEAMKLAFADREAYYGDPDFADIPLTALLSDEYAATRRALIERQASREQRPGRLAGYEAQADAAVARPRTTLSPSMACKDGRWLSFGTPGGDQQDQWQLIWFLRFVHHGGDLQALMDQPLFHSTHFQGSFFPRKAEPAKMLIEPAFDPAVIADLRARGHEVEVTEPWAMGRLTAALREPDGVLRAAATPRLMQAYAVGR